MIDDEANFDNILDASEVVQTAAKFRPKQRVKPRKTVLSSRCAASNPAVETGDGKLGALNQINSSKELTTQERSSSTCPGSETVDDVAGSQGTLETPPEDVLTVPLGTLADTFASNKISQDDEHNAEQFISEDTCKSQPNVGREKGKGKSVSFSLSDASGVVTHRDTNSEMGNFSDSCNDKLTDENLSNLSQQTSEKNSITEEQHSYDQEHNEGEPLHHAVEQQPKSVGGETGSSMKLRSRKKPQKVGTPKQTDDCFDEDCVEASLAEDIDSGDDYTAGTKRKVRKKSRDGVEESRQQKVQKDKNQVSSRGRKRTLKDTLTEEPEKKLTHRIRQRRAKEVKSLLEKPSEEINPMKLSAAHLRLLQEARERVNVKENPSGPSSNTSFQLDDMDDLDYRDDEERNFDNDRTENYVQNVTKLNYGSYMNKQTRGKWSKSDTDVFYKGLRQFGSDFAMIQQLLPDKTRHQVRAKFKAEEKKNPLLVHDAIIHRSGDNLYFKKVIKNLNIEDVVLPEVNNIDKQDGASSEQGPGKEDVLDDFINGEEDDSNWLDEDHGVQKPDVEEEHASGNDDDDDDLGNVFDWY